MSRKYINGSGADATAAAVAFMKGNPARKNVTFIRIKFTRWLDTIAGDFGSSVADSFFTKEFLLTDCPAAVNYPPIGVFTNANIKRGAMGFSIDTSPDSQGASYGQFDVEWVPNDTDAVLPPGAHGAFSANAAVSALQAQLFGFYDNALIYVYTVVMPTDYDVTTYGACLLNMGIVDTVKRDGKKLTFTVGCLIDHQDHQVPSQLIGPGGRFAAMDPLAYDGVSYRGPFAGPSDAVRWGPYFAVASTLTTTQSPSKIVMNSAIIVGTPSDGFFDGGFLVWRSGPLSGMRRPIARYINSDPANAGRPSFQLGEPFPFDATAYSAGFLYGFEFDAYRLRNPQTTESSGTYDGFPTVPAPQDAY